MEVFIETINTGPTLLLFGAGHVAQAVARTLAGTPFQVHMIDPREDWLSQAPAAVIKHKDSGLNFADQYPHWSPERTYAVVMTYDHDLDQDLIEKISTRPMKYLGLIGSRTKWQRFQKRLQDKGCAPESLLRVRCPIGLPIGGKSPQEVAISFCAEIVQIQNEVMKNSAISDRPHHLSQEDSWMEEL